jgi:hypothetical protein
MYVKSIIITGEKCAFVRNIRICFYLFVLRSFSVAFRTSTQRRLPGYLNRELEKEAEESRPRFHSDYFLQQGPSETVENVRPSDVWADTRTLDLNNTKECYQLDGNRG